MAEPLSEWVRENAFYVLGLSPGCSRLEVEREGARWLAALELGLAGANLYATPLGAEVRSPERVRRALAELRDPGRRLLHEWVARLSPASAEEGDSPPVAVASWSGARAVFGFGRRRA